MDLKRPPLDVFHMPSIHGGLHYCGPRPNWIIRHSTMPSVGLHAASEAEDLHEKQQGAVDRQLRVLLKTALEIRACPVVLEEAKFQGGLVTLSDRIWLNGASGARARVLFNRQNAPSLWRIDRLTGAFRRTRNNATVSIDSYFEDYVSIPIGIELRNGYNFYHYLTETLGSLAHFNVPGFDSPIHIYLPKRDGGGGVVSGFMRKFINDIFPYCASYVTFVAKQKKYDKVRSVYTHQHYLYAVNDTLVDTALADPVVDPRWRTTARSPAKLKAVSMCSFDTNLRLLREHALRRVTPLMVQNQPRLLWVDRDESGKARSRGLEGQEPLLEALASRGFVQSKFELHTPLKQIAMMQAADVVIMPHGAGLANMVFAKSGALVIEIGQRQTQLHRWGDFLKCAIVSGCRYETVFADIAGVDDIEDVPPIGQVHLGVRLGKRSIECVLKLVDEYLSEQTRVQ